MDSKIVYSQINSLKDDQVFCVYMRSQNACVLIRMLPTEFNNQAVISSFQAQADNSSIMELNGHLVSLFPQFSFYIKETNFIKSKSFAELLADLSNNTIEQSLPTTTKKGSDRTEVRDVVDSRFVYEWMLPLLAGFSTTSNYPKAVIKKIRDDVVYDNAQLPFRRSGILLNCMPPKI